MGIEGLLRNLQPLLLTPADYRYENNNNDMNTTHQKPKGRKQQSTNNIRQFANHSLAIDASSWLHKAGYSIADSLVEAVEQAGGDQTPNYWQRHHPHISQSITNYMVKRCNELFQHANIAQIALVFDGMLRCPLKQDTNADRSSKRAANLARARLLKSQGRAAEASELYRTCVKVPFSLSMDICQMIRRKNHPKLSCVVAPYEADAQLAKLCLDGNCHAVVTEDSDLLVYSAATGVPFPIIFKLDRNTGSCVVMSMRWLFSPTASVGKTAQKKAQQTDSNSLADKENQSPALPENTITLRKGNRLAQYLLSFQLKEKSSPGFGRRLFVQACVLAGCDYTTNTLTLDGIGFITACKLIAAHAHRAHGERFQHVLRDWKGSGGSTTTCSESTSRKVNLEEYEDLLSKSEAVFYYHFVYSYSTKSVLPLQPLRGALCSLSPADDGNNDEVQVKMEASVQMPDLRRFHDFHLFLGTDSTDVDYNSNRGALGPMYARATANNDSTAGSRSNSQCWISTNTLFNSCRQTAAFSISHERSGKQKWQKMECRKFGGDMHTGLSTSKHASTKVSPFSTMLPKIKENLRSRHQVRHTVDVNVEDIEKILEEEVDRFNTPLGVARASPMSTNLPKCGSPPLVSSAASTKACCGNSAEHSKNPFASFAHLPIDRSFSSTVQPTNFERTPEHSLSCVVSTPKDKCYEDDESVPSSLPPTSCESCNGNPHETSKNDAASKTHAFVTYSLDQFLDNIFPADDRKVEEEEEIPSSLPTEMETSFAHSPALTSREPQMPKERKSPFFSGITGRKDGQQTLLSSYAREVSKRSLDAEEDSIESISPRPTKRRIGNFAGSTEPVTAWTDWTDGDSDCCILEHENVQASLVTYVTKKQEERNRPKESYTLLEDLSSPPTKLPTSPLVSRRVVQGGADRVRSHFGEVASRKRCKIASTHVTFAYSSVNTITAGFARQQEMYATQRNKLLCDSTGCIRDSFISNKHQQTATKSKGTERPNKGRTIRSFFQPLLTTSDKNPDS